MHGHGHSTNCGERGAQNECAGHENQHLHLLHIVGDAGN